MIEFESSRGVKIFINPENVTYLIVQKENLTGIFVVGKADALIVKGSIDKVSQALSLVD